MLRKGGVTLRSMLARQTTGWPVSRGGQYENSGLFITPGSIGAQSRVLRERWMKGNGAEIIETNCLVSLLEAVSSDNLPFATGTPSH